MRFTFLGTGTSAGVPALACSCAVCTSDDPRDNRLRTSACLRFTDPSGQDRTILIDCGPDFRQQALRAELTRLDAILFTHNHVDHTWGLDEVRRFNVSMGTPIEVYANQHTRRSLETVYSHIFHRARNRNDSFVADLIPRTIEEASPLDLFGLRFEPIRLLHGRLPVLGFRIDAIDPSLQSASDGLLPMAYCTDVSAIPPESWARLTGLRTLVLDALRTRRHPTHLTLDEAVQTAGRIGADRTWLVHMSHDLPHRTTNEALSDDIQLAWDGLELAGTGEP